MWQALEDMSERMVKRTTDSKCRVPRDAQPFLSGMTALSTGGVPELNTGALAFLTSRLAWRGVSLLHVSWTMSWWRLANLKFLDAGAIKMHYGVLSDMVRHPTRILPVSSLFHYLANAVFQSGMSLKTIMELPPVKLAQFAGAVISGLTLTAAGCL